DRIGPRFLRAGPGYGGSCFPKATLALSRIGQAFGAPMRLREATIAGQAERKQAMAQKVVDACGGSVSGKVIGILGLTCKPDTDDMREAPSLDIIQGLLDQGASVVAYDPQGMDATRALIDASVRFVQGAYDAAD